MTVAEVISLVKENNEGRVKAVGSTRSSNDIADTDGVQISLQNLKQIKVEADDDLVTIGAGVTFGELAAALKR